MMASAGTMDPLNDWEAVTAFASRAVTVNEYAPEIVGVPLMVPVDVSRFKPAGSVPLLIANVTGAVPPDVCTVWLYAWLISGTGIVTVLIASAAAMLPLYDCVALTLFASVAVTVKLYAPDAPGVPLIAPVDASKLKPDGNAPAEIASVTGAVPPGQVNVRPNLDVLEKLG